MAYSSLGASYSVSVSPFGSTTVNIPVEQMAQDAVANAIPALQARVPQILDDLGPSVTAALNQQLPNVAAKLLPPIKDAVDGELGKVKYVVLGAVAAGMLTTIVMGLYVRKSLRRTT